MKILMVGISVRAMAQSAVGSGYRIVALDAFGDRDLRALAETKSLLHDFNLSFSPTSLLQASHYLRFDSVAYTSNLENHPTILRRIAAGRPIIGNQPEVLRSVRSWKTLFSDLRKAGFAVPKTIFPNESSRIDSKRQWLKKPLRSGGGHGIAFYRDDNLPGHGFMLQEYVPGKPCSASFVGNGRECILLGITDQLIGMHQFGSRGFHYCGNILPIREASDSAEFAFVLEQVRQLAAYVTQQYGLVGVNGIDFILRDGRVWPTEINPRYSASMELIEQAYDLPVFDLHARAVMEGKLPDFDLRSEASDRVFFGKAILYAEKNAIAPDTGDWGKREIRDIPATGERLPRHSPVCTVFASRNSYDETLQDLIRRAFAIKEEIYA